jgi:hypothetical protein
MSYDVYYATGGGSYVGGGADVWVNNWVKYIYPKLDYPSKLCIHRSRPGAQIDRIEERQTTDISTDCVEVWAGDNLDLFNETIKNARRVHILHGYYTPHKILEEVKDKIYSNVVHVSTQESLYAGLRLNLDPLKHYAASEDWEQKVNNWAKHKIWIGINKTPLHDKFDMIDIPNFYEFKYNKELVDSDVVGFASRIETRKAPHFIEGIDSIAFTNPYDFTWWKNNFPHKFEKTKLVTFRPNRMHSFFNREDWGISHSCFVKEPFGYSIFQSVDYGKIPILYTDWCKDFDYPYRAESVEDFKIMVGTLKDTLYTLKNEILKELRYYLTKHYDNRENWVNGYLSIYNDN